MRTDPDVTATVSAYPWIVSGPTAANRGALEYLALLADQDLILAKQLAGKPWVKDGITKDEWAALKYFNILSQHSRPLALGLASLRWANDGLSQRESQTLEHLAFFAVEDLSSAHAIAGYSWLIDGLDTDEFAVITDLQALATQDLSLLQNLTRNNWMIKGPSGDGRQALRSIKDLSFRNTSVARYVTSYAWAGEDISTHESYAMNSIKDIHTSDATLGVTVAGFPWVVDEISKRERTALADIAGIAAKDTAVAKVVAALPWLTFDVSQDEGEALTRLKDLLAQDAVLAAQVAAMPFLSTSFELHDKDALLSLLHLAVNHPAVLTLITKQAWFVDGLDDQEAKFVTVVGTPQGRSFGPENLEAFIVLRHGEARTAELPLRGKIGLTIFQSSSDPKNSAIAGQMENAIRVMESFMGVPFPREEVILLLASPEEMDKGPDFEFTGINRGTHILVNPGLARQGDTNRLITNEIARYYCGPQEAPLWFREGGAAFLKTYVRNILFGDSLADRSFFTLNRALSLCKSEGLGSIQEMIDQLAVDGLAKHQDAAYFSCNYDQGENLFLDLYNSLGADSFRSSWKDLYELAQREGRPVNETEIYQAFLKHSAVDKVAGFKDLYGRLHGGVIEE